MCDDFDVDSTVEDLINSLLTDIVLAEEFMDDAHEKGCEKFKNVPVVIDSIIDLYKNKKYKEALTSHVLYFLKYYNGIFITQYKVLKDFEEYLQTEIPLIDKIPRIELKNSPNSNHDRNSWTSSILSFFRSLF